MRQEFNAARAGGNCSEFVLAVASDSQDSDAMREARKGVDVPECLVLVHKGCVHCQSFLEFCKSIGLVLPFR